jgi:hypothetical protein
MVTFKANLAACFSRVLSMGTLELETMAPIICDTACFSSWSGDKGGVACFWSEDEEFVVFEDAL